MCSINTITSQDIKRFISRGLILLKYSTNNGKNKEYIECLEYTKIKMQISINAY